VDEILLRRILECPESTPKEMLYLELTCLPIRFILMSRRIMFLQCILQESESSLIQRFFHAQFNNPTKGDWCQAVKDSMSDIDLQLNFSEIRILTQDKLRSLVVKGCRNSALQYLNEVKAKHSKVLHLDHNRWETQAYLKPNNMSILEAKFIFLVRTRMLDVKANFKNKYRNNVKCANCDEEETQAHLLFCSKLVAGSSIVKEPPKYENVFSSNIEDILPVTRLMSQNFKLRNKLMSQEVNHVNQISTT
jgi:hypothetical protein